MKRKLKQALGLFLGGMGILAAGIGIFARLPGDAARFAEIADYGSSSKANPHAVYLIVGIVLIAAGSALLRR